MTIYNVRQVVVELVRADSEEEAIDELAARLRHNGFEPYYDTGNDYPDAFEDDGGADPFSVEADRKKQWARKFDS